MIEPLEQRLLFARVLGVDLSHWEGTITTSEWTSAKNAGYVFAWTKATQGTGFVDDQLSNSMTTAKAAGVKIGAYHFAQWDVNQGTSGAQAEADHFWNVAHNYINADGSRLVPMLDAEYVNGSDEPGQWGYTKTTFSQWINDWMDRLVANAAAVGVAITPVIYCGVGFSSRWIDSTVAQRWPLWRASWQGDPQTGAPTATAPWQTDAWQFWQYTDAQSVPGLGTVDADVLNGDVDVLKDYIIGSTGRWADGARVYVSGSSVKAWATSAANTTFVTVNNGVQGTILQGPVYGGSYQRWRVQFDNGVTGWCAEDFMSTAVAPPAATNPSPADGAIINVLPATFTWTGSGAASYDVYRDGVLQSNVATTSWTPSGSWSEGAHTWRIDAVNGGGTTTGATWGLTFDTVAPTASYGGQTPAVNGTTLDFTVTYADTTTSLDASTFDSNDILVVGPNSFSQLATFVSVNTPGNGTPRTVTYRITAPGGTWNVADNGLYQFKQQASQVKDVAGNFRGTGNVGSFVANLPWAYMSGSTLRVDFDGTTMPIALAGGGTNATATRNGTTMGFGGVVSIVVTGTAAGDNLQLNSPTTPPITLNNGSGSDSIEYSGGSYTLAAALAANVGVTIKAGASASLGVDQHVRTLSVAGSLNLAGHAIVADTLSAIGAWNGSAYTGVLGDVAAGRIVSTGMPAVGVIALADQIRIAGTRAGDADLDGAIDGDDFFAIDAHTGLVGGAVCYAFGDFDLNGRVDADDYFVIDSNYNKGLAGGPPVSAGAIEFPPARLRDDLLDLL